MCIRDRYQHGKVGLGLLGGANPRMQIASRQVGGGGPGFARGGCLLARCVGSRVVSTVPVRRGAGMPVSALRRAICQHLADQVGRVFGQFAEGGDPVSYTHLDVYKRQLTELGPTISIGIGYAAQEIDAVPDEPHDQRLDWIVTERETLRCG